MSRRPTTPPTAMERALWAVILDEAAAQKMSQAELSRRTGISTSQISRYARGQATALHPHVESAASALNRKLSSIYSEAEALIYPRSLDLTPPEKDTFSLVGRRPGEEYPKGNPDADVDEDNLP